MRTSKTTSLWLSGQQDRDLVPGIVGVSTRFPCHNRGLLALVHHSGTFLV